MFLPTEQIGKPDVLGKMRFQAARVRKPLLAASGVTEKGNIIIFSKESPCIIPATDPVAKQIEALTKQAATWIPLYQENGVFVMHTWSQQQRSAETSMPGFTRPVIA